MQILHSPSLSISAVAFSPDSRWLAVGEGITTTALYSLPSLLRHREWRLLNTQALCFSTDSRYLLTSHHAIRAVDLTRKTTETLLEPPYLVGRAEFRPGRAELIGRDGTGIHRWAFPSGKRITPRWTLPVENSSQWLAPTALCCHPDGRRAAMVFTEYAIRRDHIVSWDIDTARVVEETSLQSAGVASLARYSPDGSLLATLHGPRFRLWRSSDLTEMATHAPDTRNITGVAFTADNQRLVTVDDDASVRVWQAPAWDQVQTFEWDIGALTCVDASPDGCLFAAGSQTGRVVVWDAE